MMSQNSKKKYIKKSRIWLYNILRSKARRDREGILKFGNMDIIDKILTRAISLGYREWKLNQSELKIG